MYDRYYCAVPFASLLSPSFLLDIMYYGLSSAARSSFCSDYTFAQLSRGHDVHLLALSATSFLLFCTARLSRSFRCCCGSLYAYDGGAFYRTIKGPPGNSFYMDTVISRVIVIS